MVSRNKKLANNTLANTHYFEVTKSNASIKINSNKFRSYVLGEFPDARGELVRWCSNECGEGSV